MEIDFHPGKVRKMKNVYVLTDDQIVRYCIVGMGQDGTIPSSVADKILESVESLSKVKVLDFANATGFDLESFSDSESLWKTDTLVDLVDRTLETFERVKEKVSEASLPKEEVKEDEDEYTPDGYPVAPKPVLIQSLLAGVMDRPPSIETIERWSSEQCTAAVDWAEKAKRDGSQENKPAWIRRARTARKPVEEPETSE